MPHKNTIRSYIEGGYYHVYNRGVEKREIFVDKSDYYTFLSLIESYLTPKVLGNPELDTKDPTWRSKLNKDELEVVCYCLMPNHYHLLLKQNSKDGITRFLRRLSNAYVKYFNKKYERVGALYQGKFKSALIDHDSYLLHLSRYIHLNPLEILEVGPLKNYPFSSYQYYIDSINKPFWLKNEVILNFFDPTNKILLSPNYSSYEKFVELFPKDPRDHIAEISLD